jgi:hypothetical protein
MNQKLSIFSINNTRWISAWMGRFCSSKMLKAANIRKSRGTSVAQVMKVLLSLPFCSLDIWEFARSEGPCRDTFYRFLSKLSYNWRGLLAGVSMKIIRELHGLTGPRTDRVLILDDSPWKRDRSKTVEYLGRQYDHSQGVYYRGFRLLTAGWSDGHSFLPLDLALLTNAQAHKRLGPDPSLDRRTHTGKRSREATCKASELTPVMVRRAHDQDLPIDYVVFDSWYAQPGLIARIREHFPVVCMLKNHPHYLYGHGGRIYTLERLYGKVTARKHSHRQGPIIGSIKVRMLGAGSLRVVFVRDRRDKTRWLALGSTDLEITPEHICRIYAKRWAIEVFFKQTKQHLGLVGQFQGRAYPACLAFISIVFLRYMMLAYYQRQLQDERTIPGLFYAACRELQAISLVCCFQIILTEALIILSHSLNAASFEAACSICGIIEQFTEHFQDNSLSFIT